MNFEKALEILSKDIEEIANILSGLKNSSTTDEIELDIAISKLKNLKDNFLIFGHSLQQSIEKAQKSLVEQSQLKVPQPSEQQKTPPVTSNTVNKQPPWNKIKEAEKSENSPVITQKKEESSHKIKAESTATASKKETLSPKGKPVILSDTFQHRHEYRNESLGKMHPGEDLSSRLQSRPITNLQKSIGLNEKFQFIRDLFHGDSKKYDETIHFLNSVSSRKEANEYLAQFGWERKDEPVKRFMELVNRKLRSLQDG